MALSQNCLRINIFLTFIISICSASDISPNSSNEENIIVDINSDDCTHEEKRVLRTIFRNYDFSVLPNPTGVLVDVEMHIQDISRLSELTSEFELDVLFSSIWTDPRLSFDMSESCISNLSLDLTYIKRIWLPKTCIINSKSSEVGNFLHSSPSQNTMLTLYKNGTVWLNYRMKLRAPCHINLRIFPFDTQSCYLIIESYSYNNQRVKLRWLPEAPLTFMKEVELPDFHLQSWADFKNTQEYPNGCWDQLNATFVFKRRYGFFVLQTYVPIYMTIFGSWLSFCMDVRQISTRATLGVTTFLAISFQIDTLMKNQPPVSYVKSVDIFMMSCILLVFASLLELGLISYMQRNDGNLQEKVGGTSTNALLKSKISALRYAITIGGMTNNCVPNDVKIVVLRKRKLTPATVDKVALITIPALFFVFNTFYWVYHLLYFA